MAQIVGDFAGTAIGDMPANTALKRSAVTGDYAIVDSNGINTLQYSPTAGGITARGLSYTNAASSGKTQIFAELTDSTTTDPASGRVVLFATDSPDQEYGAYIDLTEDPDLQLVIYKRVSGSFSSFPKKSIGGLLATDRLFLLLEVEPLAGSNSIKVKAWKGTVADEPADWSAIVSDSAFDLQTATGWSGHVGFDETADVRYYAASIGTEGDPALISGGDPSPTLSATVFPVRTSGQTQTVSGTVNSVSATLSIDINGTTYTPSNNSGRWAQDLSLTQGSYTATITATDSSATSVAAAEVEILPYNSPIIVAGSYSGTGAPQNIPLDFQPDLLLIKGAGQRLVYHNNLNWHGRSNHFDADDSFNGVDLFNGQGFSVNNAVQINKAGTEFYFLAIKDNGSDMLHLSSWLGNALNNRAIAWMPRKPDFAVVKRDSPLPAVFRTGVMTTSVRADVSGGAGNYIQSLDSNGITVSNATHTNENNNSGRGEGIEGIAFSDDPNVAIIRYTGDGTSNREIGVGFLPIAALIFRDDAAQTTSPAVGISTMPAGQSGRIDGSVLTADIASYSSTGLQLGNSLFNESGVTFTILALRESIVAEIIEAPEVAGKKAVRLKGSAGTDSRIDFQNRPLLNGQPYSLEWYGRPSFSDTPSPISGITEIPLIMMGQGYEQTNGADSYDGGLYLAAGFDPDNHGWAGYVLRVVDKDYHAVTKNEGSINYHNWNTGLRVLGGEDLHMVVTHDGSGLWEVFVNGKKVKERNIDNGIYGRSNGGTGLATLSAIGGRYESDGTTVRTAAMDFYCSAFYDGVISRVDAAALYRYRVLGEGVNPASPAKEYDVQDTGSAVDTTMTDVTVIDRSSEIFTLSVTNLLATSARLVWERV